MENITNAFIATPTNFLMEHRVSTTFSNLSDTTSTPLNWSVNEAWESGVKILTVEECERIKAGNVSVWITLIESYEQNVLCREHAPTLTYSKAVQVIVLSVMAVLSMIGNIATMISIKRGRNKRGHCLVYRLIFHLALADLLVTVFCIVGEAAWSYTVAWTAGNLACKVIKFLQVFSLYLSTFVLVLIGVDRFVVVRYPMKSLTAAGRLGYLIAVVWAASLILSIPQLVIFRVAKGPFYEEFYQCVTYGFYTEQWQEQLYTTFSLVCMFILPLIILISTYVATVITIARSEKVFRAEVEASGGKSVSSDANRRRLIHRAKMKSMRISVVIVMTFIIWWTPYYTMMIIFMFLNPDKYLYRNWKFVFLGINVFVLLSQDLQDGIFFFGMSNSLVNPIIYGAFHLYRPKKERISSTVNCYRDATLSRQRTLMTNVSTSIRVNSRVSHITRNDAMITETSLQDVQELIEKP